MKKMDKKKVKSLVFKITPFLIIFAVNLILISLAFGSGAEEAHPSLVKEYAMKIINFAIIVAVLIIFGKKPIQSYLRHRTETIEKTLREAREAKELAQKALQEVEERLKTKDKEIEDILSASRRSGEQERDRITEEAAKLRERIYEQAKTNIEYELKQAKDAIKAEAVEIAIELAEKKIKEKLTKEEQERLLEESLSKIGGKG